MNDLFYLGIKAAIKNADGQVLLLKTKDYWDLPGGRIQVGETEIQALTREITEETGLTLQGDLRHIGMCVASARLKQPDGAPAGLIFSLYACDTTTHTVALSDEHINFEWMTPAKAAESLSGKFSSQICDAVAAL